MIPGSEESGWRPRLDRLVGGRTVEIEQGEPYILEETGSKEWNKNPGRTLYHGTVIDNRASIERDGLLPIIGDFVADFYGSEYALEGDDKEVDSEGSPPVIRGVVFAADKGGIDAATGAMQYHVGRKLGKYRQDVTRDDLVQHGMLVIIKDVEPEEDRYGVEEDRWYQARSEEDRGFYAEYPGSVEPGDWFMTGERGSTIDAVLTGRKMVRFLERHGAFKHAAWNQRRQLIREKVKQHGDENRRRIVEQVQNQTDQQVSEELWAARAAGAIKSPRQYWGAAGAGVLPFARSTGRFLIAYRSGGVMEPRTWGTIGGRIDEGETAAEAAWREFEEETGQDGNDLGLELQPLFRFVDPEAGFQYFNFLGLVDDEFEPEANWETDEWRWVTQHELRGLKKKHFGLKALVAKGVLKELNKCILP